MFILQSIFEKFKCKNGDVRGLSVDKLFSMMKKLGLKLGRGEFATLMVKYDPKQTHVIRPEKFAMFLLDHVLIVNDPPVSSIVVLQFMFSMPFTKLLFSFKPYIIPHNKHWYVITKSWCIRSIHSIKCWCILPICMQHYLTPIFCNEKNLSSKL